MRYTAVDAITIKLDRAEKHIEQLEGEIELFLNKAPDREVIDYDPQTAESFNDFHENRLVPPGLSIVAGEVIYQLRSSLDHLICALVLHDSGTLTDKTQFPIFSYEPTKNDELKRYQGQIEGIKRTAVLAIIKGHQPYTRGRDRSRHPLAILKSLSNIDKHRSLNVHIVRIDKRITIQMRALDGTDWERTHDGPDDGTDIPGTLLSLESDPIEVVNVQRRLTTSIAFEQFGTVLRNFPVTDGLRGLFQTTHAIFSELVYHL